MARKIKIAAAQYPLDPLGSLKAFRSKLERWVADAARQNADLILFPEYGGLELAAISGKAGDMMGCLGAVSDILPEADAIHADVASHYGVTIFAGSAPVLREDGRFRNVTRVFTPDGQRDHFDKIMPTPGEREPWRILGGRDLKVFDLGVAKVGLVICYDIEFPLLARSLAEAGAEVILAPSLTETEWGYWRVRTGSAARALENQIYTVQVPLIGTAPWCAGALTNHGMAGVFAPPDVGLPLNGIVALGELNTPQLLVTELDLDLTARLRHDGTVKVFEHWTEQPGASLLAKAQLINLSKRSRLAAE